MLQETEVTQRMGESYRTLEEVQKDWYQKSCFTCPEGCGSCCHDFEPELYESEAIFMASYLIDNHPELAVSIAEEKFRNDYDGKTCIFFDAESNYHCSIYGGRPFICRLFGASMFRDKEGRGVWRPCRFYPLEKLKSYSPLLDHRQYSREEAQKILGSCPPVMADIMEQALSINHNNLMTRPLRRILPETIRKLLFVRQLENMGA